MRYAILLHQAADGSYQATVPALPHLSRTGATRDETLQAIRQALVATLTTTELLYVDIPNGADPQLNPWLTTAGLFADDPTLEPLLQTIYADRDAD